MIIEREIGEKGQVVIPKDIRNFLGLHKGQKVVFEINEDKIILKKPDPISFVEDFLNVPRRLKKGLSTKEIKKTILEQYDLP